MRGRGGSRRGRFAYQRLPCGSSELYAILNKVCTKLAGLLLAALVTFCLIRASLGGRVLLTPGHPELPGKLGLR
jgi:hypothetical protein